MNPLAVAMAMLVLITVPRLLATLRNGNNFKLAITADICDYIKPELRHKPDVIIIHCGTNDIENEINTVKKIKKLVKEIDEYDKQNPPKVVISSLIKRYDKDFNDDIANINEKLQRFCNGKGLSFIDNNNIDRSCLNKGKLHLNRQGLSYLANNF